MKHKKKKTSLIHSCKISSICLLLCVISLFSLGYSTWYSTTGSAISIGDVNVNIGEVIVSSSIGLKDYGFDIVKNSATTLTTSSRINVDNNTIEKTIINENFFQISTTVDIQIISKISYSDNAFLTISFSYTSYSSKNNNIISALKIYPENYTGYYFYVQKSNVTNQKKNGATTNFYLPLKTKNDISLSTIASLDSTYPRTESEHSKTNYKVPIIFNFDIDEETLNTDILTSNPKYTVIFGLSTTAI